MAPEQRRRGGQTVTVTADAQKTLASHQRRVNKAQACADEERGQMYTAIDTLVADGELTTEAAAHQLGISRATLMRALAANRNANAKKTGPQRS